MKIYLAARYSRKDELERYARKLEKVGHTIVSRWHTGCHEIKDNRRNEVLNYKIDQQCLIAEEDVKDLTKANCIMSFTEEPRTGGRGGRHVEFGLALALNKIIFVIGPREHVFHCLPQVVVWPTFDEYMKRGK